ncbi:MAG TPA: 23S rRNA pseudouridine(1911/1915/1917) synthase RluD [Steroidobacteraceae bacterium]|nr:23S rRNA pseudouridine(1911/1915/1917) synthase RluD [Steroidobacteraceae bacterium]
MPSKFQTHRLDLPPDFAGRRLDQALAQLLPQYSRTRIQRWIEEGAVLINGLVPRARDVVTGGESATVEARLPPESGVAAEKLPLDIVHQDAQVLVINKPPGMVVHPGAGNREHTLQNALLAHDAKLKRVPRAGLVHRIDKDTSGLLVVARTLEAHTALVAELGAHEIEREYLALCTGAMTGGGTVDEPIGRHRTQRTKMTVRSDGRKAVTHFRIEKRFRAHTLARVHLETGRTHQIRVHMAHVGYPIVGDPAYGGRRKLPAGASPELVDALQTFPRQALHAARLTLTHPKSGKRVSFDAPLPGDLAGLLDVLARDLAEPRRKK